MHTLQQVGNSRYRVVFQHTGTTRSIVRDDLTFEAASALVNYLNGGTGIAADKLAFIAESAIQGIKEHQ